MFALFDRQNLFVAGICQQVPLAPAARKPAGGRPALLDHFSSGRGDRQAIGEQPPAVFLDADGNRFVPLLVQVLNDGGGRGDRYFMLARSTAVDDADTKFFHYLLI